MMNLMIYINRQEIQTKILVLRALETRNDQLFKFNTATTANDQSCLLHAI